jgi:hypothetical protein
MGRTFHIAAERAPVRCEVCHQADFFNPGTGDCERCSEVVTLMRLPRVSVPVNERLSGREWTGKIILGSLCVPGLPVYFFLNLWAIRQIEMFLPPEHDEDSLALLLVSKFLLCLIAFLGLFLFAWLVSLVNRGPRDNPASGK